MPKVKQSVASAVPQQTPRSLPHRLLTFKIQKVGDVFLADMAFTVGLAGAYVFFKDATQAFLWGTLILGFVSVLVVPPVYLICRSIEKKMEGSEKE